MPDIDHRIMNPPFLRVSDQRKTPCGDTVYQWDLRVAQPNVSFIAAPILHSIEHFLGVFLKERTASIITVAPMGCQTGFYITAVEIGGFREMADLIENVLQDVVSSAQIPLAHPEHCGWSENHSLIGAQQVAAWLLSRRAEWGSSTLD